MPRYILMITLLGLVTTGFTTCKVPMGKVCDDAVVQLKSEIHSSLAALEEYRIKPKEAPERKLASGTAEPDTTPFFLKEEGETFRPLEETARVHWAKWSRRRLNDVQYMIDMLDPYPELRSSRRDLLEIANDLVNFHGYAESGSTKQLEPFLIEMNQTLDRIDRQICTLRRD